MYLKNCFSQLAFSDIIWYNRAVRGSVDLKFSGGKHVS